MKLRSLIKLIESVAPIESAYEWDNVGLMIGNLDHEVNKILVTLDVTLDAVNYAILNNCNAILSHHPLFFTPIKSINTNTQKGKIIELCLKNDICIYSAHTNLDIADDGINKYLIEKFNAKNVENLTKEGLGRIGDIEPTTLGELIKEVASTLKLNGLRYTGDINKEITRIAISGGACADEYPTAIKKGCQVLITADLKYHWALDSLGDGISIIDAGHHGTEKHVTDIFEDILKQTNLEIIKYNYEDVIKFAAIDN